MVVDTPDWVKDAVFYQIFPDRFAQSHLVPKPSNLEPWESPPTFYGFKGGDLLGVAEKLDYLQDLGITAIYFTPVFASAANHRYHTYDYLAVDPILGGTEALRELVDQAHERRMRVVLDGVFNHCGRGFYPFHHALENGAASPYLDWFHINPDWVKAGKPLDGYYRGGQPVKDGAHGLKQLGYEAWWGYPALPKLNTRNPAVRDYIFGVAERWLEFGIDGWRIDTPDEIDDDDFWREFRRRVKSINKDAYLVGELWNDSRRWLQGDQFDAVMNYLLTKAILGFFIGKEMDLKEVRMAGGYKDVRPLDRAEFTAAIASLFGLYDPAVTFSQLNLLGSHDTPRFLTCARGDETALRMAVLFLFAFPGAPCVYYGDEIGMEGRHDPDCRRAFPWGDRRWNHALREYYRQCIALRREHAALRRGDYIPLDSPQDTFAFARADDEEKIVLAFNLAREPRAVPIPLNGLAAEGAVFINTWSGVEYSIRGDKLEIPALAPRCGIVLVHEIPEPTIVEGIAQAELESVQETAPEDIPAEEPGETALENPADSPQETGTISE